MIKHSVDGSYLQQQESWLSLKPTTNVSGVVNDNEVAEDDAATCQTLDLGDFRRCIEEQMSKVDQGVDLLHSQSILVSNDTNFLTP